MKDFIYIAASVAFFGVMLAYVMACRALGARGDHRERGERG